MFARGACAKMGQPDAERAARPGARRAAGRSTLRIGADGRVDSKSPSGSAAKSLRKE